MQNTLCTSSSSLKNQIKLVVSDLDGTLLNSQHQLTDKTIETVQRLVKDGFQFMLATGRHYQDVHVIAQQLGVEMGLITSNGARVHGQCGTLLYESQMPSNLVEQVLDISKNFAVHRNLYQQDYWLVEEPHDVLLSIHHASGFKYQLCDFSDIDLNYIDKIYFTAEHDVLVELETALKNILANQLYITFTSPQYLEVMNLGVSKAKALEFIEQQRGIELNQIMAFGDGMNDKEMLKLAGHGVVMDNACQKVKGFLADLPRAASNDEEGVASYLHEQFWQC